MRLYFHERPVNASSASPIETITLDVVDDALIVTETTYAPQALRFDGGFGVTYTSVHRARVDASGVVRWISNGHVVPADCVRKYGMAAAPGFDASATDAAREREFERALVSYRAARARGGYGDEERAEMRAAFGADASVIDVITGERVPL